LAHPFGSHLILQPFEASFGGCDGPRSPPGLKVPPSQRWVQVTGHFADPASSTCRYTPDPLVPAPGHPQTVINDCLERFVATRVVTVAP
jgi:hypothetical protein